MSGRLGASRVEGQFELPDGWRLDITREEDGRYLATLAGNGKGVRSRGDSPDEAVATLASAIGQEDRVGLALRAYVIGGEKLLRHAIADSTPTHIATPATRRGQPAQVSAAETPRSPENEQGFEWIPVRDAAYRLGVTPETVRGRIRKDELRAVKDPLGRYLVRLPEPTPVSHGGRFFAVFNPLTAAMAFVVGELIGEPRLGAIAGLVIFVIFGIGIVYTMGVVSQIRLR